MDCVKYDFRSRAQSSGSLAKITWNKLEKLSDFNNATYIGALYFGYFK